jgi:large subunit ribosomal protein L16
VFEMAGVPLELAREAMRLAAHKLPIETRFIVRGQEEGDEQASGAGAASGHEPAGAA